jgi:hypothetical protein
MHRFQFSETAATKAKVNRSPGKIDVAAGGKQRSRPI